MLSMDPDWSRPGAAAERRAAAPARVRRNLAQAITDYSRAVSELLVAFGLALALVGIAAGLLASSGWL